MADGTVREIVHDRTDRPLHPGDGGAGVRRAIALTGALLSGGRREDDGRARKCTLCYDRLRDGLEPACAKACPTDSIQFGPLDELRERAALRVEELHARGVTEARLYGHDPNDGVGGDGAFFLADVGLQAPPGTCRI